MPALSRGGVRAFSQSRLKNNTLPCVSARDAFETCLPGSAPPAPRDHPQGCVLGGGARCTAPPSPLPGVISWEGNERGDISPPELLASRPSASTQRTRCRLLINTQLITCWGCSPTTRLGAASPEPPLCQQGKVGLGNCPWGLSGPSGTGSHAAATTVATTKATTEATTDATTEATSLSFLPAPLLHPRHLPSPDRATTCALPSSCAPDDAQILRGYPLLSSCHRISSSPLLHRAHRGPGERPQNHIPGL